MCLPKDWVKANVLCEVGVPAMRVNVLDGKALWVSRAMADEVWRVEIGFRSLRSLSSPTRKSGARGDG